MGAEVVLVGLDGADREEIVRLARAGQLPVLARMRAEGRFGAVRVFDGLGDDAAWCSFSTGVGPGAHGRRFYRRYAPGTYDWVVHDRADIRAAPFWDSLAEAGRRVVVLDVPKSPIGDAPANLVVADWMSHGAHTVDAICSPGSRARTQLAHWVDRAETTWDCHHPGSDDEFVRSLCVRAALRADLAIDTLGRADWDALVMVFGETHCAGHGLWDDRERFEAVSRALDAELGRIIEAAGPAATVIVFSLLGMGPGHVTTHLADAVLAALDPESAGASSWRSDAARSVGALVPHAARACLPARLRRAPSDLRAREFGRRRFWRVPTDLCDTPIRINVIGREPHGKVAPGPELDRVHEELRREFLALVEPGSGRRLVRDVIDARDAYRGDAPDDFADLLVIWDRTAPLVRATSPRLGPLHVEAPRYRPGEHRDGGWLAAIGPGITSGGSDLPVSPVDFAPTVARLVGAAHDGEREGRAIPGIERTPPDQAAVVSTLNVDHSSA